MRLRILNEFLTRSPLWPGLMNKLQKKKKTREVKYKWGVRKTHVSDKSRVQNNLKDADLIMELCVAVSSVNFGFCDCHLYDFREKKTWTVTQSYGFFFDNIQMGTYWVLFRYVGKWFLQCRKLWWIQRPTIITPKL